MKISSAHGVAYLTKIRNGGWYLESVMVDSSYRNKGIGSKLMEKILTKCDRPIFLLVTPELGGDVEKLIEFYESFGFEKTKKTSKRRTGF